MSARFDLVTLDAADTEAIARFWSSALRLHEVEREDGDRWIVLADADGTRRIGIQRGTARRGSLHLDLVCELHEFDAELDRLGTLGAELLEAPAARALRFDRKPGRPRRQCVRPLRVRLRVSAAPKHDVHARRMGATVAAN
jgi:hypothetical protein